MMYLSGEIARKSLQTRVQVRFRSEEQLKALAEERAMVQRRAKLKDELETRREANRAIKERQRSKLAGLMYIDCDGLIRQGGQAFCGIDVCIAPTLLREKSYSVSQRQEAVMRRRRRITSRRDRGNYFRHNKGSAHRRSEQKPRQQYSGSRSVHLSFTPSTSILSISQQSSRRLAFYSSPRTSYTSDTKFTTEPQSTPHESNNEARESEWINPSDWYAHPRYPARVVVGDRSETTHPAFWGNLVVALDEMFANETCTRNATRRVNDPCHICLSNENGCPFCFEMPTGLKLHKYSYMPGDCTRKDTLASSIHTDLTTRGALERDRRVRHDRMRIFIKTIPCGKVVQLELVCDDTVDHVHHLFRASSTDGMEVPLFLFIPLENGLLHVDIFESWAPLNRYGLNKSGAWAVLLHGSHVSCLSTMNLFLFSNMPCATGPNYSHHVMTSLDGGPRTLPGEDSVQLALHSAIAHTRDADHGAS